jgi:ATP/maltotriose-dependent transcriptional regulator MalT
VRAVRIFDELGAVPAGTHARRRLRQLGVTSVPRGPNTSTAANPARLTQRELEVLGLVAAELSNMEIAERLFLSDKTVERHLSSVFAKLDVASRGEAVREARRRGALPDMGVA